MLFIFLWPDDHIIIGNTRIYLKIMMNNCFTHMIIHVGRDAQILSFMSECENVQTIQSFVFLILRINKIIVDH